MAERLCEYWLLKRLSYDLDDSMKGSKVSGHPQGELDASSGDMKKSQSRDNASNPGEKSPAGESVEGQRLHPKRRRKGHRKSRKGCLKCKKARTKVPNLSDLRARSQPFRSVMRTAQFVTTASIETFTASGRRGQRLKPRTSGKPRKPQLLRLCSTHRLPSSPC